MNKQQKERMKYVAIVLTIIFIAGFTVLVMTSLGLRYICPFKEYLNIDCPGCGGTRMVISILHREWLQAFRYNPFIFVTIIPMGLVGIWQICKFIHTGDFSYWLDKVLIAYAIALTTFGVIRNIEVFSWLKPTII